MKKLVFDYISSREFRTVALRTAAAAFALLLAFGPGGALAQETISVRSDFWYPFNGDPSDSRPGYVVEMLKAIFEKGGGKVDYQTIPWKRAVAEAEQGKINGVIGALKSDTPDFIFPEEPIGVYTPTLFVKKGSGWSYSGLDSLKGKRIGIINGYSYGDKLDAYVKQNQNNAQAIDESSGEKPVEQSIRKLMAGRVDAFIEVPTVFWAQVDKLGLDKSQFQEAGVVNDPEPMFVSFSPKRPDSKTLATKLTNGIRELRRSGELAKILARYSVKDWAK